jgi:hypothetical protein
MLYSLPSFPLHFLPTPSKRAIHFTPHHLTMSLPPSSASIHEFALSNGYVHAIGQPFDAQPTSDWYITSFSPANRPTIRPGTKLVIQRSHNSRTVYYGLIKSVIRLERRHISLAVDPRPEAYGDFRPAPLVVHIPLSLIHLSPLRRLQHFVLLSRLQDDIKEPHELRSTASLSPASTPSQRPAEPLPSSLDFLDLSSSTDSL